MGDFVLKKFYNPAQEGPCVPLPAQRSNKVDTTSFGSALQIKFPAYRNAKQGESYSLETMANWVVFFQKRRMHECVRWHTCNEATISSHTLCAMVLTRMILHISLKNREIIMYNLHKYVERYPTRWRTHFDSWTQTLWRRSSCSFQWIICIKL